MGALVSVNCGLCTEWHGSLERTEMVYRSERVEISPIGSFRQINASLVGMGT